MGEGTVAKFGALHVALASAGIMGSEIWLTSKSSINIKKFRKVVDINLMGGVYMAKYASVEMAKNKLSDVGERGVLLFISSIAGYEAQRGQTAYGATKAAVNGIVLPMARDLGRYGIRAVAIAPGVFDTPMAL